MSSDERGPRRRLHRLGLVLALAWFAFVNVYFYWDLFRERAGQVPEVWDRLLALFR